MFVCCSGDLRFHLLQGGRGGISGSEVVSCSYHFQYFRWNRLCINTVSSRRYMSGCCFQKDGTQDLFSFLAVCWKPSFAQFISLRHRSQFAFFKLKLVGWGMGLIVRSICKLMRIGKWSELRFRFVCQLVEVIKRG